jgi:hypothetical protein
MGPQQSDDDLEVLALADATDRVAEAMSDPAVRARLHRMAEEMRAIARHGRGFIRRSRDVRGVLSAGLSAPHEGVRDIGCRVVKRIGVVTGAVLFAYRSIPGYHRDDGFRIRSTFASYGRSVAGER